MLTTDRKLDNFAFRGRVESPSQAPGAMARTYGLADISQIVWRHRKLLLSIVAAGTLICLIVVLSLTNIYTATSAIVFDRNDTRPYEAVVEARKQERDKSAMETELDVIRSRGFVGTVVDAMNLTEDPYYNTYLESADTNNSSWLVSMWNSLHDTFFDSGKGSRIQPKKDPQLEAAYVTAQRDMAISRLLSMFQVDRQGDSLAMKIRVEQPDPTKAAKIANAIAQSYVAWTSDLKAGATASTLAYLRKQAEDLGKSIGARERAIATFAANSDLTFEQKDDLLRAQMEQLSQQYVLARVDEASALAKVNEVRSQLEENGRGGASKVVSSEFLATLRTEKARLNRLRAQLTSKYGNNHPLVVDVDAEIESNLNMISDEAGRILREFESNAKVATVRAEKFATELKVLQDRIKGRNLAEIQRRELERDLLTEQKQYDAVVLRLNTLSPEQEEAKPTAMVASFAEVPKQPSFPQPTFLIVAGILGSVILALIVLIIVDALDDRLHKPESVEELLNKPNLVTVPDFRKGRNPSTVSPYDLMLRDPDSIFAGAVRGLCLAWRTSVGAIGGKVVMFTSISDGDGKTTFSLAMAATAKTNGLRTILVDLDPSNNGAGKITGVKSLEGSIDKFMSGQGRLEDIVVKAPGYPFHELIVGRLAVHDYERLFNLLRDKYDLIVVDTPSLEDTEDAIWISSLIDSIFVVVTAGKTRAKTLSEAVEKFNSQHAVVIGGVINYFGKPRVSKLSAGIRKPIGVY